MWLNIDRVHQPEIIGQVGLSFGLHSLVAEDIACTGQRPKMEHFDDYIFIVLRMLRFGGDEALQVKAEGNKIEVTVASEEFLKDVVDSAGGGGSIRSKLAA
jgi:Mg2+ and Co2+ transporter CorA